MSVSNRQQRRTLLAVLMLNALLALALGIAGVVSDSSALLANALDNASDAAVYLLSFIAVGRVASLKRRAARVSGVLLLLFASGVLVDAGRRWWTGAEPVGWSMMAMALIAAAVNLACLRLLRGAANSGDVNLRAARTFSLNDFASNGGVLVAGGLVMWLDRSWPDLAVGILVAVIAINGGLRILHDAKLDAASEMRSGGS